MTLDGRVATTGFMFAIFTTMSIMALGFPAVAGFMPLLIGVPGAVLCGAQLVVDLRKGQRPSAAEDEAPENRSAGEITRREAEMFGWLAVFTLGLLAFGFMIGGPILVFLFLRFGERESWRTAIIGGAGTWLVLYGIFDLLLELPLFEGFVMERLLG